jgi:hypothetical protein
MNHYLTMDAGPLGNNGATIATSDATELATPRAYLHFEFVSGFLTVVPPTHLGVPIQATVTIASSLVPEPGIPPTCNGYLIFREL